MKGYYEQALDCARRIIAEEKRRSRMAGVYARRFERLLTHLSREEFLRLGEELASESSVFKASLDAYLRERGRDSLAEIV